MFTKEKLIHCEVVLEKFSIKRTKLYALQASLLFSLSLPLSWGPPMYALTNFLMLDPHLHHWIIKYSDDKLSNPL